ncbi:hypothetical protein [uncultured Flavobacterium sp.]|mgnify:FL=1|uniref:hypothetical protein n=1 Tax=uncultured Flavobacterium sp. TaxID=165435 RepID=UPI002591C238|nr:hypothetical protein [uncultured Flavobacterium sp.]
MNNEEIEYSLTVEAKDFIEPKDIIDEVLFLTVKQDVLDVLNDPNTDITYFGFAPDNTADNQDDLLLDGVFFRIIAYNKDLELTLESSKEEVLAAYSNLVTAKAPYWTTIISEKGFIKEEITIELLYQ